MRITQGMMARNYTNNLAKSMRELSSLSRKMTDFRQFHRASENPFNALSALKVRRTLERLDTQKDSLTLATSVVDATESIVKAVKERLDDAMELILRGENGTFAEDDHKIIATALRSIQDQMLKLANTQVNGRYILGGAQTGSPPFEIAADGRLLYNGQDVNDTARGDMDKVDVFIDIGLGVYYSGDVLNLASEIDKASAFSLYSHGCDIFGYGVANVAAGEPSNNIYTLLGQIADIFDSGDLTDIYKYHDRFTLFQKNEILVEWTKCGERTKQIDFMLERNDELAFQAERRRTALEAINPEKMITEMKTQEMIYRAALQLGTYIFPATVLDYLK